MMENERVEMTLEARAGARVRELREQRGWSQADLGRRLAAHGYDMHQTTVAKLESAGRPIRLNELGAAADILGVSLEQLYEVDELDEHAKPIEAAHRRVLRAEAAVETAREAVHRASARTAQEVALLQQSEKGLALLEADLEAARVAHQEALEARRQRLDAIETRLIADGGHDG